jgi:hypothetical protein
LSGRERGLPGYRSKTEGFEPVKLADMGNFIFPLEVLAANLIIYSYRIIFDLWMADEDRRTRRSTALYYRVRMVNVLGVFWGNLGRII